MEIEELIKIAESNSWTVTEEEYSNGKGLLFSKYSPAGQDFSISTGPFESAEELMKRAATRLGWSDEKIAGLGTQILQIHDSILVECPEANARDVGEILQRTMESIAPELPIKLKVDVSIGVNWGEV